jgi:2-iminobutanoate/2-iminopropanoate deaminase
MLDVAAVLTNHAPAPVGPYSQAIRVDGFIFCSGQVGLDPATGKIVEGGVAEQTRRVLDNLGAVLAAAGLTFDAIVKTTIFLVDINDFATVNAIYGERIGAPAPARSTIAVAALPLGARVEIEAIASAGA